MKAVKPEGETYRRVTPSTGRGGVGGLALCSWVHDWESLDDHSLTGSRCLEEK